MLNRYFGPKTHDFMHVLGMSGIAFGVPMNKVVMSVSMMFIVLNLILEAEFKNYWKNLLKNKLFHLVFALVLLHLIGVLWSENISYALHDLKVKLPLLVIPTILAAKPIVERKSLNLVLLAFLSSCIIVSFLNFSMYQGWIGNIQYDDIRGMSWFSSHVRFALIISMAVACLLYFIQLDRKRAVLYFVVLIWFVFYTFYSQVIAGAMTLIGVLICYLFATLWKRRKVLAISFIALIAMATFLLAFWIFKPISIHPNDYKNLPELTKEGHNYTHNFSLVSPETGKPLYILVCDEELIREWTKLSNIPIDGKDQKGQPIRETIIRYLASKDLTKDAEGLSKLSVSEIKNIEKGHASFRNRGVLARLYGIKHQLNNDSNPNGHSLLERIEYWKAGFDILTRNLIIGVGTGDVQDVFEDYYEKTDSPLYFENRHRAHNLFLTIGLTFGVFGLSLFLWLHLRFIKIAYRNKELLAILFVSIALISFMMEDTIETQTGVTFYALFIALFCNKILPLERKK